ncbi:TolB family protein, partial [Acidobacteriota bacterium]
ELYSFEVVQENVINLAWSIDGKRIYFYSQTDPANEQWDMWMYSMEDKQAQKTNLKMSYFRHLSVHPNGRHLAFSSSGVTIPSDEVWVMENFLPKTKDKK